MTEQTYIERTTAAIEALESALRRLFKADDTPPIPYVYNGITYDIRDRETRMLVIAAIQDAYYQDHGEYNQYALDAWYVESARRASLSPPKKPTERPSPAAASTALMDRLTDAVLYEELTDTHPDKMTRDEYPIMSDYQEERRRDDEYEDVLASDYDVKGINCAKPERRHRTERENRFVEKLAQKKNRARKAQYKRDTSAGDLVEYNLKEGGGVTESFVQRCGIGARWLADMASVNEISIEPADEGAEDYVREAA